MLEDYLNHVVVVPTPVLRSAQTFLAQHPMTSSPTTSKVTSFSTAAAVGAHTVPSFIGIASPVGAANHHHQQQRPTASSSSSPALMASSPHYDFVFERKFLLAIDMARSRVNGSAALRNLSSGEAWQRAALIMEERRSAAAILFPKALTAISETEERESRRRIEAYEQHEIRSGILPALEASLLQVSRMKHIRALSAAIYDQAVRSMQREFQEEYLGWYAGMCMTAEDEREAIARRVGNRNSLVGMGTAAKTAAAGGTATTGPSSSSGPVGGPTVAPQRHVDVAATDRYGHRQPAAAATASNGGLHSGSMVVPMSTAGRPGGATTVSSAASSAAPSSSLASPGGLSDEQHVNLRFKSLTAIPTLLSPFLVVLDLVGNRITSVAGLPFLGMLQRFMLNDNAIADSAQTMTVVRDHCPELLQFGLLGNPCAPHGMAADMVFKYRAFVVTVVPSLTALDDLVVQAKEKETGARLFPGYVTAAPSSRSGPPSSSSVGGSGGGPASGPRSTPYASSGPSSLSGYSSRSV